MSHLSPAHHETSKRDSPHKIDRGRTTKISCIQIQSKSSQLLITYQTKVLTTWFLTRWPFQLEAPDDSDDAVVIADTEGGPSEIEETIEDQIWAESR
jgi:hypothetical protein